MAILKTAAPVSLLMLTGSAGSGLTTGIFGHFIASASATSSFIWISPFLWPGYLVVLGSHVWMVYRAYQENPLQAILFSVVPFYAIYYSITRWERIKAPAYAQLLGWVIIGFSIKIIWPW